MTLVKTSDLNGDASIDQEIWRNIPVGLVLNAGVAPMSEELRNELFDSSMKQT